MDNHENETREEWLARRAKARLTELPDDRTTTWEDYVLSAFAAVIVVIVMLAAARAIWIFMGS